ncbi:sensor histidine kinase [Roseibacillus ishigakijimensis]|uniref:histidine kinase n=1 Tax=Roseibacillus ishigakijimensis TaxID=454146 RepID=A0A934RRJ9_9BACT|nr:ATP-binding protein [Roseibacillus ishigakijimensis]MBK1834163.1 HAMP domain-containing protein [Roseibacillus ishigakijimensis]
MKVPFHSLRWRLQLWHALISLALIVAACLLADRLLTRERVATLDADLRSFERSFVRHGLAPEWLEDEQTPPSREHFQQILREFPQRQGSLPPSFQHLFTDNAQEPFLIFWDQNGDILYASQNAPPSLVHPRQPQKTEGWQNHRTGSLRWLLRDHPSGLILVGRDISPELTALTRFRFLLASGGAGLFLAALAGGWWLVGRALKPIDDISQTASRIAAGNLAERIQVREDDSELTRLANVLNGTFDQLADSLERQKRFTADASHELRTPLSIILSETQRGLRREREAESYRAILSHCQTAATRMRRLVESLLALAREDLPSEDKEPCNLAETVAEAARQLQPLAEKNHAPLTQDLQTVEVPAVRAELETLVQTLLSNALSHPPAGTPVTLRTYQRDGQAHLEVHDQGPGIPPEHLPHLCERFYQVDKARSHSSEHSGLGLAIAQAAARKLGGELTLTSSPQAGTTARFTLPLPPPTAEPLNPSSEHRE